MSSFKERLNALGLTLPPIPVPQGAYIPAVLTGSLVFVAGQIPMRNGVMEYTGRLGLDCTLESGQAAARLCFLNAIAAVCSLGFEPENIVRVVQLNGFVQCTPDFWDHPKVLNGASLLAQALFGESGTHARMAVGAQSLPLNAAVEIAAVFEISAVNFKS